MGAAASIPLAVGTATSIPFAVGTAGLAVGTAGLSLPAAAIFVAGVAVGAALGPSSQPKAAANIGVVNDALNLVTNAAEAVMHYVRIVVSSACAYDAYQVKKAEAFVKDRVVKPVCDMASSATDYVRTAASSAWEKLKAAAAFLKEKVAKLLRRLRGSKEAAAASREVDLAEAADQDAGHDDVLSRASARVARVAKAVPPSSAIVAAAPTSGALTLWGSVAALAEGAARRASEMMAVLKDAFRAMGDGITRAARSCINGVVAAVGICLEAIGATAPATTAADAA